MNKKEFLAALGRALPHRGKGLRSILNFYSEMIDDLMEEGCSEAEAVERIGSVDEVCAQILSDGSFTNADGKRRRGGELLLLILGAPLWFALLLAGFAVAFALYAVLWSLIAVLWAIELPFLLFSLVSRYLFPACQAASLGALFLTRRGSAVALGLFKRGAGR
jgi:uncharacterized membrane protein